MVVLELVISSLYILLFVVGFYLYCWIVKESNIVLLLVIFIDFRRRGGFYSVATCSIYLLGIVTLFLFSLFSGKMKLCENWNCKLMRFHLFIDWQSPLTFIWCRFSIEWTYRWYVFIYLEHINGFSVEYCGSKMHAWVNLNIINVRSEYRKDIRLVNS